MGEHSIASARASVMIYDDTTKKWIPSGSSSGLSKVQIFHHQANNTFRVVGRKLQDHEVVINCAILKGLKYNQATVTFHQWRDNKQVYGLNFSSKEDADNFARAMFGSLDILSNNIVNRSQLPPVNQSHYHPTIYNGQGNDDDVEYSSRINDTHSMDRRVSQAQTINSPNASSPGSQGHHRTSSAPPAPQPPSMTPLSSPAPPAPPVPPPGPQPWINTGGGGVGVGVGGPPITSLPPLPPGAPTGGAPPPPPPPPAISRSSSSDGHDTNSLAAQLQSARLKRINANSTNSNATSNNIKQSTENSGSSTSSSGSNYGTLGRGMGSMASMMDEMAKTLARRRAAVEKKDPAEEDILNNSLDKKNWNEKVENKILNNSGEESPKINRKRFGSEISEDFYKATVNGGLPVEELPHDLEVLKQEILKEIRRDLAKMKQEIIDVIKSEGIRR